VKARRFTLISRDVMCNCVDFIARQEQDGKIEVIVQERKAKRSGQQNRRLHKIIGMCAKEAGYTIAEMKITFKEELLEPLEIVEIKDYRIPEFKSTAAMSVSELNSFMEQVENLAAKWYSVRLPAMEG